MKPIEGFIVDCEEKETPWLVWYAPYLPHQPHDSPEKFYEIARGYPGVKEHEIPYFASIAQFDETVGELVSFVEANADVENTIFVFVSDNGWSPGETRTKKRPVEFEHTKTSKRAPFDEGVRSPILFRWDGRIEPGVRDDLVSSVDIVATLFEMTGVGSMGLPGRDIIEGAMNPLPVFGEIYPGDATSLGHPERDIAYRWVRDGDWKLILPVGDDPWGDYLDGPALYNVSEDPGEKENRIGGPESPEITGRLEQLLNAWWDPENHGRRVAQNFASVCMAAKAAGHDFVADGGGDLQQILKLIGKGTRIENEDSPFDGVYFGTAGGDAIDLKTASRYLKIENGMLLYESRR